MPIEGDWIACKVTNHTGPLLIGEVNYGIVRPGVIIKVHREQLPEAEAFCTPYKVAKGAKVDHGPMGRYAFWPKQQYGHLKTGTRVEAWRFYFLPVAIAESANFPFEAVPSDRSRVGSRLKKWFTSLGFIEKPGCSCKRLRIMLDEANLAFIHQHHDEIVAKIVKSAEGLHVTAPRSIVTRMLSIAAWQEKRRL